MLQVNNRGGEGIWLETTAHSLMGACYCPQQMYQTVAALSVAQVSGSSKEKGKKKGVKKKDKKSK